VHHKVQGKCNLRKIAPHLVFLLMVCLKMIRIEVIFRLIVIGPSTITIRTCDILMLEKMWDTLYFALAFEGVIDKIKTVVFYFKIRLAFGLIYLKRIVITKAWGQLGLWKPSRMCFSNNFFLITSHHECVKVCIDLDKEISQC